ncbi:MAG: septation protein A [Mariprofundaceae bacterium]|nr:septation protein A [Mariprofundaceae bacterium]
MKFLFDFFPVLIFFISYKVYDIYVATAVLIIACLVQTVGYWAIHRRFEKSHVITLLLVSLFGGATLLLQDEMFIKWKPSVINWLFGVAFIGSQFIGKQPLIQRMLGSQLELPQHIWRNLNSAWALFFIALGSLNLYVVYHYDTDTWVDFKMFGLLGLTLGFMLLQGLYLTRYLKEIPAKPDA